MDRSVRQNERVNLGVPVNAIAQFLVVLAVLALSACATTRTDATLATSTNTTFVFVKITDPIPPLERARKYEDPLDAALKAERLGEVTGGGSQLTKEGKIDWIGVDVDLVNLESGIPFLKRKLLAIGAPRGSSLEYQTQGKKLQVFIHD